MRVLIVEDGRDSYLLPAVRSLGAAGCTVGLAGPGRSRSASSRWVSRVHHVPPAEEDLAAFASAVRSVVKEGGYDVVFGGDDVEVLALSAVRADVGAVVPYATHESVVRAIDKLQLLSSAQQAGLATPWTVPASAASTSDVGLPVVVKARLHWTPGAASDGRARLPARTCATVAEAEDAIRAIARAGGSAVLQEVVEGSLMAVTTLCAPGGRVLAESHQVASRVSLRRGTSTRARTVPIDEELSGRVGRLLADLGWFGIANLQFLRPASGPPLLIDLNGRFYGSLALALAAGLDLPVQWVGLALPGSVSTDLTMPVRGRPGVRYQALEEDLRRARTERRGGLFLDVMSCLGYAVKATHSTWNPADPRPALSRVGELLRRFARRLELAQTAGQSS